MNSVEKDVRDYIDKYISAEELEEESSKALTFSYIMGMPVKECRGMNLEPEMSRDQEDEYYEVEGYINKIKKDILNK